MNRETGCAASGLAPAGIDDAASGALLRVRNLRVTFQTVHGPLPAVRGVDLDVQPGETVALVGESGSGKSASMLGMLGLLSRKTARVTAESLRFDGRDLRAGDYHGFQSLLGGRIGVIFQDPQSSLNPTMRVGRQIAEVLRVHGGLNRRAAQPRVLDVLDEVGIPDPRRCVKAYPHELSGGMRQRVMIAIATICDPALLIADEPTTALDVTLQAQIVDLLARMQRAHGSGVVFITHDLSLVSGFADRIYVLYAGQVVETNSCESLVRAPKHPYSRALLASVPHIDGTVVRPIPGRPPDPRELPTGCAFRPRCEHAHARCGDEPPLIRAADGSTIRCWLADREDADVRSE
jgi:oligopeptide/dipeptide ABC transporter ATP-binding protein